MGLDIELVTAVLNRIGCRFSFVPLPWKRALVELELGRVDIVPTASYREERTVFSLYSNPYRYETVGLVVRNGEANLYPVERLEDFLKLRVRIGILRGAWRGDAFEAFEADDRAGHILMNLNTTQQAIQMLLRNRIDFYVEMPAIVLSEAAEMGQEAGLEEHPFVIHKDPVHFIFSKKTVRPELVRRFNAALSIQLQRKEYKAAFGSAALNEKPAM
ncbi:polar amino acid transport system substrate-binding protein [Aestuariispira insulae]|uniref:Polar amino acid transport system substrate-binding protein n=1 Tax=Aestuariispira insulae TaxID=1461337 RepID=A0A3D9HSV1_9PROT|nr:polar amino acid transport system substrate-binding protein [Aestuariispira insulae]